ncbi:MAG: hypothetical protein LBF42_00550, partial [Puniceicoccales bacterium]|nr:hypothetical protein [Puniceicoccales bacterium]
EWNRSPSAQAKCQNARSAKGKKVFGFVAGKKFQRRNIVAGIDGKIIAECIYNCITVKKDQGL